MSTGEPSGKSPRRIKRVKRLKRIIVVTITCVIFIPLAVSIYYGCMAHSLKNELANVKEELNYYLELQSESDFFESEENLSEEVTVKQEEKKTVAKNDSLSGKEVDGLTLSDEELYMGYKKIYLTFDDGPSPLTDDILDILKEYDVKATFFVVKREGRNYENIYQRIVDEGHALGMHSCNHVYKDLYADKDAFMEDTNSLRDFLYLVTGVESDIYRFPGGSSNRVSKTDMHVFADALQENGIVFFDWNVSAQDATAIPAGKGQIVRSVISKLDKYDDVIILFHDLDTKSTTVEALPEIIEYIQSMDNTVILPISRDTNPIQHLSVKE